MKSFSLIKPVVVSSIEEAREVNKPLVYIANSDGGLMQYMKTEVGEFIAKPKSIRGIDDVEPSFSFDLPKIPFLNLCQIVSFFKDVAKEVQGDEAMVLVYFNKETKEYKIVCPEQTTNKVHVTFVRPKELELDPNYVLVMDIHSHNTMGAFFSGTDDASEQETRVYGVFGEIFNSTPAWKFRMGLTGSFKPVELFELFERPVMKYSYGEIETEIEVPDDRMIFPKTDYPAEWMALIIEGKKNAAKFSHLKNPTIHSQKVGETNVTKPVSGVSQKVTYPQGTYSQGSLLASQPTIINPNYGSSELQECNEEIINKVIDLISEFDDEMVELFVKGLDDYGLSALIYEEFVRQGLDYMVDDEEEDENLPPQLRGSYNRPQEMTFEQKMSDPFYTEG